MISCCWDNFITSGKQKRQLSSISSINNGPLGRIFPAHALCKNLLDEAFHKTYIISIPNLICLRSRDAFDQDLQLHNPHNILLLCKTWFESVIRLTLVWSIFPFLFNSSTWFSWFLVVGSFCMRSLKIGLTVKLNFRSLPFH